jgi:cellulose synthase/poly-beta-1,6-N-acetylglucosamine synthase-like glycosyltransferase
VIVLILFGLGCVFGVAAAHPYFTYPLTLRLMKPAQTDWRPAGPRGSLAICMCAYNEERVIVAKVESLLRMAAEYGPATVHVFVDGASDRTAEFLAPYADRIDLLVSQERSGKTAGMNILISRLDTELIACTDANVRTGDDAVVRLVAALDDPAVACASARLIYENPRDSGASGAGAAYWTLEEWVKGLESRTISLIGVDGALFVIRRSAYRPSPSHLIDDLYVSLNVLLEGYRVVSCPEVLVSERSAVSWREEFRRKRRIACQGINVHRAMWPRLVRLPPAKLYGYVSHRLLKALIPFNIAACAVCFWAIVADFVGAPAALAFNFASVAVVVAGALLGVRLMRLALGALIALVGVGSGVLEALVLGRTYIVWTPAASVRD